MQIFVKFLNSVKSLAIKKNMKIKDLNKKLNLDLNLSNFKFIDLNENEYVSSVFRNLQTINLRFPLLGGANITEGDKLIALKAIECKICRRCYARNSLKAKTCRKRMCGWTNQLRLKKTAIKKK